MRVDVFAAAFGVLAAVLAKITTSLSHITQFYYMRREWKVKAEHRKLIITSEDLQIIWCF
ncbi:hypothetical protein D1159_16790 [Pseudoflavonifractor sp. 524-17]|nr:hypothetical protein [Pseudoflavonifractor sp. 524-17]